MLRKVQTVSKLPTGTVEYKNFIKGFHVWQNIASNFSAVKKKNKFNRSHPNPGRREKINLNFYFQTSLWCLKRFYEGLKGLHKTF